VQIFVNPNYDFVGRRRWFYGVSVAAVVLALLSIAAHRGLRTLSARLANAGSVLPDQRGTAADRAV